MIQFLQKFYKFLSTLNIFLFIGFCIFFIIGLALALLFSPTDYQQGDGVRIMYIHVPSAILSISIYVIISFFALIGLIHWKNSWILLGRLAQVFVRALLPIGGFFTFITLITGSLWGKPMWGTWWIWDARLTSDLILFFIYIGAIGLINLSYDKQKSFIVTCVFILVGLIDLPIIHYSVQWWTTLHQGSGIVFIEPSAKSHMADFMIMPLEVMSIAFLFIFLLMFSVNIQKELLLMEQDNIWVKKIIFRNKKKDKA